MQKFLRYLFLTVATAVFVSCEDSVVVPETVFEISEDRIDAAYSGGTYKVGYTLTNPVEGERVEAFSEQEWIGSFDTSADGENLSRFPRTLPARSVRVNLRFIIPVWTMNGRLRYIRKEQAA